jgi:hypothetical protein
MTEFDAQRRQLLKVSAATAGAPAVAGQAMPEAQAAPRDVPVPTAHPINVNLRLRVNGTDHQLLLEIEAVGAADGHCVAAETIDRVIRAGTGAVRVAVDAGVAGVRADIAQAGEVAVGVDIIEIDHAGMGGAGQHQTGAADQ